jgi:hypothetical protein
MVCMNIFVGGVVTYFFLVVQDEKNSHLFLKVLIFLLIQLLSF